VGAWRGRRDVLWGMAGEARLGVGSQWTARYGRGETRHELLGGSSIAVKGEAGAWTRLALTLHA
jgi:hypothetical protein